MLAIHIPSAEFFCPSIWPPATISPYLRPMSLPNPNCIAHMKIEMIPRIIMLFKLSFPCRKIKFMVCPKVIARARAQKWRDHDLYLLIKALAFGIHSWRAKARKNGNAIIGLTLFKMSQNDSKNGIDCCTPINEK